MKTKKQISPRAAERVNRGNDPQKHNPPKTPMNEGADVEVNHDIPIIKVITPATVVSTHAMNRRLQVAEKRRLRHIYF